MAQLTEAKITKEAGSGSQSDPWKGGDPMKKTPAWVDNVVQIAGDP